MYNITPNEAYDIWFDSLGHIDDNIYKIIESLIKAEPEGLPFILGRNPTINFGSILQVFCVGINRDFTMSVSLQILKLLAGDFDGDVLYVVLIINQAFGQRMNEVFNPRNNMYISKNDGKFNCNACISRDSIINSNTLMNLGNAYYTPKEIEKLKKLRQRRNDVYI